MERDLDNIARHFDKYPNFAIDTAARMRYLMLMPPKDVRVSHQVSGSCPLCTDLDFLSDPSPAEVVKDWQSSHARDWNFLATSETLNFRGRQVVEFHNC
jgi:hypothetical protein